MPRVRLLLFAVVFLVAAVPGAAAIPSQRSNASSPNLEISKAARVALQYIAATEEAPMESLVVVNEHRREYPLIKRVFWGVTVLDKQSRRFHQVLVDSAAYQVANRNEIEQAESQAYLTRYGKLDPDLYDRLQKASSDEIIPVAVWLTQTDLSPLEHQLSAAYPEIDMIEGKTIEIDDPVLIKQVRQEKRARLAQLHQTQARPLTDFLAAQGYQARAHKSIPIVTAYLPPQTIQSLTNRDDVDTIYLAGKETMAQLKSAIANAHGSDVWTTGVDGSDIDIAILEWAAVRGNPSLNVIATYTQPPTFTEHPNQVAAAAASRHSTWRGMAYGADIISANHMGSDINQEEALWWALDQGADVVNISEIITIDSDDDEMHPIDRAMDYIIRNEFVTIVAVAGNMDLGNHIGSPGKAYDVITVGSFNDLNVSGRWTGSQMSAFSAWNNPRLSFSSIGDREKPEVVAAGENITSLDSTGNPTYLLLSGTSYAAPQVAGLAGLMMDQNSVLMTSPEAVKAIIMASAVHNIEGPPVIRQDGIDDKDGAGAIVADKAVEIASAHARQSSTCNLPCWWGDYISDSNFPVGTYRYYRFTATAGERVRVAIAWHANASASYMTDPLDTNLELLMLDPDGQSLEGINGYSASWNNSYEIVEFEAPKTGVYLIGVYKTEANESSNWLGVAWTRVTEYDAAYLGHTMPGLALPDQDYRVCFKVRNDGYWEWPVGGSHPVHLGYRWYDAGDQPVSVRADHRTTLPMNLGSGDVAIPLFFCGWIRTPVDLGRYTLKLEMVHEGVAWFGDRGDEPLTLSVTVTDTIIYAFLPVILKN